MPFDLATAYERDYEHHDNAQQITWTPQGVGAVPVPDIWAVAENAAGSGVREFGVFGQPANEKAFWIWTNTITGGGTPIVGDRLTDAATETWTITSVSRRHFEPALRITVQETR